MARVIHFICLLRLPLLSILSSYSMASACGFRGTAWTPARRPSSKPPDKSRAEVAAEIYRTEYGVSRCVVVRHLYYNCIDICRNESSSIIA